MADRRTRQLSIAIIGAGMAGLTCANTLNRSGFHVSVFDKSRGLGGRLATRRAGDFTFDHGAQYITARSPEFRTRVLPETESANCAIWNPDVRPQLAPKEDWFVGVPGMSALVKWFEDGISVTKGTKIVDLSRSRFGWKIASEDGWIPQSFDFLVLAIPAPQASELINRTGIEIPQLNDVLIAPCWTLMAAFDRPFDLKHDALRLDKGPIAWMARNQSKPERPEQFEQWVVHASPDWSVRHLEADKEHARRLLLEAFRKQVEISLPAPTYSAAHRWRYALVEKPLGKPFVFESNLGLGLIGDWCIAPRVEAAFQSGLALAEHFVSVLE